MWVRLGILLLQLLARLSLRLAPFLLVGSAALVRRYRWRVYDNVRWRAPRPFSWSRVPLIALSFLFVLLGCGIGLYFLVGHLAPT